MNKWLALVWALLLSACVTTPSVREDVLPPESPASSLPPVTVDVPAPATVPLPPVAPTPPPVRVPPTAPPKPAIKVNPQAARSLEQDKPLPAVLALWQQSQREQRVGQYERAAASIERALHIDPRNPWLYQGLAKINIALRRFDLAEGQALKANSLARNNAFLQLENWRMLAVIRRERKNPSGASEADQQVLRYEKALK